MSDTHVDQVDYSALRLAFEAVTYSKAAKARRAYHCRFCSRLIDAGERYLSHGDRAAHVACVERLAASIVPVVSHVG